MKKNLLRSICLSTLLAFALSLTLVTPAAAQSTGYMMAAEYLNAGKAEHHQMQAERKSKKKGKKNKLAQKSKKSKRDVASEKPRKHKKKHKSKKHHG